MDFRAEGGEEGARACGHIYIFICVFIFYIYIYNFIHDKHIDIIK